jgi:hypothetical protein
VEDLFLKVLGSGGNDGFLFGEDNGSKIAESLARACPCLDDRFRFVSQRLLNQLGQLELGGAKLKARNRSGKRALRTQDLIEGIEGIGTHKENIFSPKHAVNE